MTNEALTSNLQVPFWFCSCRHPKTPVYYADELQKRTDEVERLRAALERIVKVNDQLPHNARFNAVKIAREALSGDSSAPETSAPYLHDRANGVQGVYCIGRVRNGTTEYWTGDKWAAFCGDLYFDLRPSAQETNPDWRCPRCGSQEMLTSPFGGCCCGWNGLTSTVRSPV